MILLWVSAGPTPMLKSVFRENLYQLSIINNINCKIVDGLYIFIVGTSTILSRYGGNRFSNSDW
jgi:hypothetical protein